MGTTKAGQIENGMCLLIKGHPFLVVEREFVTPGKGSAFCRAKLKNLRTGQVLRETMKTNDVVEEADVVEKDCQFMYSDDTAYHFMDNDTYDQFEVQREGMESKQNYLKENLRYTVIVWEGNPIDIILPLKMTLVVTEASEGLKGDTVTGATKVVKVETGLQVRVPIFIKQGEKIMINTETGEYVERVNS